MKWPGNGGLTAQRLGDAQPWVPEALVVQDVTEVGSVHDTEENKAVRAA